MILKESLQQARSTLASHSIEEAVLEGELLLRHALKLSRTQMYLDINSELSPEQEETFWQLVKRRLKGEPTNYITGHREFYGLDFYVNPSVLIPRPESELLVEKAIELTRNHPLATIADIGTGCGAIAISLAIHLPSARIYATDISASALEVALFNCQKHGVTERICLLEGDMLDRLPEPADLIVANLPYVKESELAQTGPLSYEPPLALNGGPDGLEKIDELCSQLSGRLNPQGCLLLEIGQGQGEAVSMGLRRVLPSAQIEVTPDFNGIERMVSLRLTQDYP